MGVSVTFEPATVAHAQALAPLMRAEDVAEVLALGYPDALSSLTASLANSDVAWAALADGEVAALFGVAAYRKTVLSSSDRGRLWFLTGRAFGKHPKAFLRLGRQLVAELLKGCGYLENCIDARYTGALRFAGWIGCTIEPAVPRGPLGLPFHPFHIRRSA